LVGESLLKWGSNDQKKKWLFPMASGKKISAFALSEPEIGSDASKVQTSYVESGNKFIINGKKKWISFGDIADIFLVIASNKGIITAFILERDFSGIKTKKMQGLLAGKASHIAEIIFDNVEVPKENVLGKIGAGFSFITNTALDHGRYSIAWAGVAIAQAAIEEMVMYSRTRNQFGKKLHEFQLIRGKIADSITNVNAARALCLKAGELRKNNDDEAEIYTTMAKHFSSKIAMSVAAEAVQIHGGNGCYDKFPVERLFREAKILEIIEGTTEIQQEIISAYGLRKYYRSVKNKI
jgi:alkylation response protein AidB-like acyl-CoA dehydrogenase